MNVIGRITSKKSDSDSESLQHSWIYKEKHQNKKQKNKTKQNKKKKQQQKNNNNNNNNNNKIRETAYNTLVRQTGVCSPYLGSPHQKKHTPARKGAT